jgi:hypothetical protein
MASKHNSPEFTTKPEKFSVRSARRGVADNTGSVSGLRRLDRQSYGVAGCGVQIRDLVMHRSVPKRPIMFGKLYNVKEASSLAANLLPKTINYGTFAA